MAAKSGFATLAVSEDPIRPVISVGLFFEIKFFLQKKLLSGPNGVHVT